MIKTLIVDDHTIVREGLKQILSETSDITVTGEASDGAEAIKGVLKDEYNVVVLDISMPGRSGLEVLKELKSLKPKLPVLILSMHPEEQYAIRAYKGGASGYLTKDTVSEELIAAIRKVARGGKYVSPAFSETLVSTLESGIDESIHKRLSDREYQVMLMIARGKSVKDIARELFLSVKTVSTYRGRILEKMNMKNNAEIIRYAFQNKLIE